MLVFLVDSQQEQFQQTDNPPEHHLDLSFKNYSMEGSKEATCWA